MAPGTNREYENFIRRTTPKSIELSVDTYKKLSAELLTKTDNDLEIIRPSLKDLVSRIEKEKPDAVVFLDKSARIFASPIKDYLKQKNVSNIPEFDFYNDDKVKGSYLGVIEKEVDAEKRKQSVIDNLEKDLEIPIEYLKGRKIFVVDETFAFGVGMAAIKTIKDKLNLDLSYFALSYAVDPEHFEKEEEEWEKHDYPLSL